jgi:sortase A
VWVAWPWRSVAGGPGPPRETDTKAHPRHRERISAAPERTQRRAPRRGRVLRFVGRTFLTAAFLLAAYLAWLLWGTGFYTAQQQDDLRRDILSSQSADVVVPGGAYAILKIRSIDLDTVVVEGTDVATLKKGPGHYPDTAHPWQEGGRVAIAGHRTTYGAPFWDLDKVSKGDVIEVYTRRGTFVYRVTRTKEILPTQTEVLRPTNRPTLILTTCSPKFSAARRLIVFGRQLEGPV